MATADFDDRVQAMVARGDHPTRRWLIEEPMWRIRGSLGRTHLGRLLRRGLAPDRASSTGDADDAEQSYRGFPTRSQSRQDVFVQVMTEGLGLTTYLELGAAEPDHINNTFVLERDRAWRGLSVEIDPNLAADFRGARVNDCLCADATQVDYAAEMRAREFPPAVGYLSVDIDPSYQSLAALLRIPFDEFDFATITFEHDAYRSGTGVRDLSREILRDQGYELAAGDVKYLGRFAYEDWWVHPTVVPDDRWRGKQVSGQSPETFLNQLIT